MRTFDTVTDELKTNLGAMTFTIGNRKQAYEQVMALFNQCFTELFEMAFESNQENGSDAARAYDYGVGMEETMSTFTEENIFYKLAEFSESYSK